MPSPINFTNLKVKAKYMKLEFRTFWQFLPWIPTYWFTKQLDQPLWTHMIHKSPLFMGLYTGFSFNFHECQGTFKV